MTQTLTGGRAIIDWAQENLQSHATGAASIIDELPKLGIEIEQDAENSSLVRLRWKDRETQLRTITWEQERNAMINRGLGLLIIDSDKPDDYVQYYSAKHRVLRVDAEGELAKTAKPAYAIIGGDQVPAGWFGSYLYGNEQDRQIGLVDHLVLLRALHKLFGASNDFSSRMFGRGSEFRMLLDEMEEALKEGDE